MRPSFGHERPPVIDRLRERLRELGWTVDPCNQAGQPYGHNIHIEGPGWNITATYRWPHPASMLYDAFPRLELRMLLCEGSGHGGRMICRAEVSDVVRFESEPMPEDAWLDLAVAEIESLRGFARHKIKGA